MQRIAQYLPLPDAKSLRLAARFPEQQTFNTFAQRYCKKLVVGARGHTITAALEHLDLKRVRSAVRILELHLAPGEPGEAQSRSRTLVNARDPRNLSVI